MLSIVSSAGLIGTDGFIVHCETDIGDGLPAFNMIGYLSSEVRESSERVKTAMRNAGFPVPGKKVTINLSPGNIKKEGTGFDLAIAVSLLKSIGYLNAEYSDKYINKTVFLGELSLSGKLLPIKGVLSLSIAAREAGYKNLFVSKENAKEAAAIDGINVYGLNSLKEVYDILSGESVLPEKTIYIENDYTYNDEKDFSDINGQESLKRATIIAVAGRHNILYIGPAGTGKSMIASRIPGIMPKMTKDERINISKIYSVSGLLSDNEPLVNSRPFRNPHHTISPQALTGGGSNPKPGEISLASGGVLFLDELAEFKSSTIEALRQPMEDRKVVISRVISSVTYPADFVLCAATNPCKCGYYPDRTKCHCTDLQVKSYLGKISKPILDRIDISIETNVPKYDELVSSGKGESSETIRKKVEEVRLIQSHRFRTYGINFNAEMNIKLIDKFCILSESDKDFIRDIYEVKNLSARGLHKILKVARTIADYEGNYDITHENLCEAISYRLVEERFWGGGEQKIEYRNHPGFVR